MQLSHWAIVIALSLAAPLPAADPGATPDAGGTLSTAGNVWTNAVLLPSGGAVHSGAGTGQPCTTTPRASIFCMHIALVVHDLLAVVHVSLHSRLAGESP